MLMALAAGCKTSKGTGAMAGAGVGALIGQAAGKNTQSTLIGAAVGTGVGYIIGDQIDEKKAKEQPKQAAAEVAPLGGTRWRVANVRTSMPVQTYASKIVEFRPDGRLITTTTGTDGNVTVYDESYRVVGTTLIVNKPGYLVNAKYVLEPKRLLIDDARFSAVLERL